MRRAHRVSCMYRAPCTVCNTVCSRGGGSMVPWYSRSSGEHPRSAICVCVCACGCQSPPQEISQHGDPGASWGGAPGGPMWIVLNYVHPDAPGIPTSTVYFPPDLSVHRRWQGHLPPHIADPPPAIIIPTDSSCMMPMIVFCVRCPCRMLRSCSRAGAV